MFAEVSGPSSAIVQVVPAIKAFSENEITLVDGTVLKDVDSVVFTSTLPNILGNYSFIPD